MFNERRHETMWGKKKKKQASKKNKELKTLYAEEE
jgi:hypothetical protein